MAGGDIENENAVVGSVSYTHLDVYKRQSLPRPRSTHISFPMCDVLHYCSLYSICRHVWDTIPPVHIVTVSCGNLAHVYNRYALHPVLNTLVPPEGISCLLPARPSSPSVLVPGIPNHKVMWALVGWVLESGLGRIRSSRTHIKEEKNNLRQINIAVYKVAESVR